MLPCFQPHWQCWWGVGGSWVFYFLFPFFQIIFRSFAPGSSKRPSDQKCLAPTLCFISPQLHHCIAAGYCRISATTKTRACTSFSFFSDLFLLPPPLVGGWRGIQYTWECWWFVLICSLPCESAERNIDAFNKHILPGQWILVINIQSLQNLSTWGAKHAFFLPAPLSCRHPGQQHRSGCTKHIMASCLNCKGILWSQWISLDLSILIGNWHITVQKYSCNLI